MRYVVVDVEASGFDGFPIEVGWCDQDGNSESHLICPAWNWTDWDTFAEHVHGISREVLTAEGEPHAAVAKLVADMLARCRSDGIIVASDNPDYDQEWLVKLFRRADIHDGVLLNDIWDLYSVALEPLFAGLPEDRYPGFNAAYEHAQLRGEAIVRAAQTKVAAKPKHRAADDARRLREIVTIISTEVIEAIGPRQPTTSRGQE